MKNQKSFVSVSAWCLYDWASSSYSSIITTFIFATYFTTKVAQNEIIGTYQWANATSIAGLIIAITSPLFGAIADHAGYHKRWLFIFTAIAVLASCLLWFAYPSTHSISFTLSCIIIGTVCYEVAQVFYNAFLPTLVTKKYLGRVSGWGWGCGYLGGIFALSIVLFVFVKFNVLGLNEASAQQIRISGPFVGMWYLFFALPLFYYVPPMPTITKPLIKAIISGSSELWKTLKRLPSEKNILLYLFAHMIYNDGLNTLFAFGGIYAAGTYGLSFEEVLLFGISMNITAGVGAIALSWMDDFMGSKLTVMVSLIFLIILGVPLLFLQEKALFWTVALMLSVFIGPVQSASRSLMVRLIAHKEVATEMFGLYALSGKITAFVGPWLLGLVTLAFGSQRFGMATVLIFFIVGGLLLIPVRVQEDVNS